MGVDLQLTGLLADRNAPLDGDAWLDAAAAWLENHEEEPLMLCRRGLDEAETPTLYVHVHPAAEEMEIRLGDESTVHVAAKTSTVGPGYHLFLCDLLRRLGQRFAIAWQPPTDDAERLASSFFSGDADEARHEMRQWLASLARVVGDADLAECSQVRMVSMPLGYAYPDQVGVVTPLGPRSLDWFRQVADVPERGEAFFPWWSEGVGGAFYRGRALCRMWQDVRWRVPITEDEGELLMDVHLDLERAYRHEPTAELPWHEWREILDFLQAYFGYVEFRAGEDLEALVRTRANGPLPNGRIGYRRGPVLVSLTGGWTLTIPGEFAEEWDRAGQAWSAWAEGRTIVFTSWSVRAEEEPSRSAEELLAGLDLPDAGDMIELRVGEQVGRGVFTAHEEDGEALWNLKAYSAVPRGFALCNIFVRAPADFDWALDVWKSLRH